MKFEGQLRGHEFASRAPRIDVSFKVLVRCAAGEFDACMINLSAGGFCLRSTRPLEPGWELTLEVPKLAPVNALVRWVAGNSAGGVFTDPVIL